MDLLSITDASRELSISVDTLRRWDKSGLIKSTRNQQGHRLFDKHEIQRVQNKSAARSKKESNFKVLKSSPTKRFNAIDLFAGAGGTALGLDNSGFDHLLLSEIDQSAAKTLKTNRPDWNVVHGDVAAIDFSEFRGKVDLLEGGFPCQAFSYAGQSRGFEDTRGTLFFEFARAVSEAMPKVFIGENVKGLQRHDHGRTLETMIKTLRGIKDEQGRHYKVGVKVLRAQYLDVAQKRERLIIVGLRSDLDSPLLLPKEKDYIISLWEAIGDCPKSSGQSYPAAKQAVLELVPPGGYWRDLPEEMQRSYLGGSFHLSGGKTGMARRLSWDEPSLTLTCSPAQKQTERCHPAETRPLNVREYARIQSFPDDWKFEGSTSAAYKQIGNAVPVNMAFHIGQAVRAMLTGENSDEFEVINEIF